MQTLEKNLKTAISKGFLKTEIRKHISDNLNPKFKLRPYQKEALARFEFYIDKFSKENKPDQLLFHMATGSGKTLIIASTILDLYKRGYQNFIFFVNSKNIIDKTRDNFLNPMSSKYLFNHNITIHNKTIEIKEVDNFQAANQNCINIIFTTIQGLHSRLNTPKENSLTNADFEGDQIALLSDEAHHINAQTKKKAKTKDEVANILSWEETVNRIFKSNKNNILLEFTATADLANPDINKKYKDKLLFDYPLKQFRIDKYSKNIKILQTELESFDRALLAIIMSQYRRKLFQKHKINIKPVILFKSKTIKDSENFYNHFEHRLKKLNSKIITDLKQSISHPILKKAFDYFNDENISIDNLITELKEDFSEDRCISVDSKNDSYEKQLHINSLEDQDNKYRAVFAVDKLNEGWDVLNLFDIVRLYDTKINKNTTQRISKTTMSEAQLIGRGARYCPFQIDKNKPADKRKYDDLQSDLRICEELYYHSTYNPNYILNLNNALEKIGIKISKSEKNFKNKTPNKQTYVDKNKISNTHISDQYSLIKPIRDKIYRKKINTGDVHINEAFDNFSEANTTETTKKKYNLNTFSKAIRFKALRKAPFYRFDILKQYFPYLNSIEEFIASDKYLNQIRIEIEVNNAQLDNISNDLKLKILNEVFEEISELIQKHY